ncbi:MAG: hypothetical protein KJO07_10435, partial [Deltaproteobacteria bacterium]|nr:hypothetical protein [Deltaproteobacteria bacterium]
MSDAGQLLRLGERYAALGLTAAASSCFERAADADPSDGTAHRRLVELALAAGRGKDARSYAQELGKREKGLATRLLTGQAQMAAGELAGARFSFAAVADAARAAPLERVRAMVGRAKVAEGENDRPGASANIMGAAEALFKWMVAEGTSSLDIDREQPLIDEVVRLAVAWERTEDIGELIAELKDSGRASPAALLEALWLAARQSHGDRAASDREIDAALQTELDARPDSRAVRVKRCERLLRRRRHPARRDEAIADLVALADEVGSEPAS